MRRRRPSPCSWRAGPADRPGGSPGGLAAGHLPVPRPYRWLRAGAPLPHSGDVTSDPIAAWPAGALGAGRVVLIKPPAGDTRPLVDPLFIRSLPPGVEH